MEIWFQTRPQGMLALSHFTDQVHSIATKFLRERIVIARSVEHQLATALALLDEVSEAAGLTRVPAAQISVETA